jgi:uncharacterized protein involved in outer membrane biogenesis
MKRPVRIAVIAGASLLGLAVVAYAVRNPVATAIARSAASGVLGVPVEIGWVSIDVWGAAVEVQDVKVGNPKGFDPPHALTARRIAVDVSSESSTSRLVVESIDLDGVGIWFLMDGTRNNVAEIVKGMDSGGGKEPSQASSGGGTEVLIRRLTLTDAEVHLSEKPAGKDVPVLAKLSKVEARNISSKASSVDLAAQVTGEAFEAVMAAVVSEMGTRLPAAVGKGVTDALGQAGTAIGGALEGAAKGVGDTLKGVGDGLGGMFGGKK